VLKDSHGIPAPRIDYKIGENTARMMEHGVARAKEILAAAEATDICVNSPILYGGWHLLGTARMGADPALSAALKQPGKGLTSCPGCCIAPPASRYPDGFGRWPLPCAVVESLHGTGRSADDRQGN